MARSPRYRSLLTRLTELRRHLLPSAFDPTSPYTPRQVDRTFAYRLLAHAELEHCLEQLVVFTVAEAWSRYRSDHKPRTSLLALVAYYEGQLGGPPETLQPGAVAKKVLSSLDERIDKARHHHVGFVVRQNNGMTERNVLRLLMPVGVHGHELDPAWLNDVEAFSVARGSAAHQSGRVQQIPDPETEYKRVHSIARGMRHIDERLTNLRDR